MTQPSPPEGQNPALPTSGQTLLPPTRKPPWTPRLTSPTRQWTRSKKIYNPTACKMEPTKLEKKRWQRHIFQVKEQDETPEEHPSVHYSTVYNPEDMEAIWTSTDGWMNKDAAHVYDVILLSHKKEWHNAICSNMDGPRDCHTEWSQRKTKIIWYHLYVESKRNDTNGLIYKTETDSQTLKTNLRLPKGKGEGQG